MDCFSAAACDIEWEILETHMSISKALIRISDVELKNWRAGIYFVGFIYAQLELNDRHTLGMAIFDLS